MAALSEPNAIRVDHQAKPHHRASLDAPSEDGGGTQRGGLHLADVDDENGAAFYMHCSGLLRMVVDAAGKAVGGGKVPPTVALLKQHAESLIEQANNGSTTKRPPNGGGGEAETQSNATTNTAATPMLVEGINARRRWTAPHYAEFLAAVLNFLDTELLPFASNGASLVGETAGGKLRKLSRDMLQLVVVRASSMLSHRLPHLLELSVCRGFFMWHRQQCRRGAATTAPDASAPNETGVASTEMVASASTEDQLSESVLSLVREEEDRLRQEHASPHAAPINDFPHNPIMHALLTGVLEAERCLLRSIELLAQCCPPSSLSSNAEEVASVRVVTKSCVDVARSVRLLLSVLHQRLDKAVEKYVTEDGLLSCVVAGDGSSTTGAQGGASSVVVPESAVPLIAASISSVLGVDVGRLLINFGFEVCRTTCGYLIHVASITGTRDTLSAAVYRNKSEAKLAMFRMMDTLTPDVATTVPLPGPAAAASSSRRAVQSAMRRRFLPTSLFSDCIAAIARHCGDENDGQLLCVKLLTDGLNLLCGVRQEQGQLPAATGGAGAAEGLTASSPSTAMTTPRSAPGSLPTPVETAVSTTRHTASPELECFVRSARHRRAALSGLLNALVSVHRPVLSAALTTMECLLTETVCIEHAAQEVGFVYANSVIRLLESDNSSAEVKYLLVQHFRAMLSLTIRPSASASQPPVPLLLVLFRLYDVNRRLHQLHVVQQYVAALARIVRIAGPHEFVSMHHHGVGTTDGSTPAGGGSGHALAAAVPAPYVCGESLPQAALAALVAVMEIIAGSLPHAAVRIDRLRDIALLREEKTDDQRVLDIINNTPVKGICKRFFIDKFTLEQLSTQQSDGDDGGDGTAAAAATVKEPSLEYSQVPPPPNPEVASKVAAVADFLLHTPALNPMSIGEFLSDPKFFPLQVCRCFMMSLDLKGRSITGALSEMLSVLQLPKEGQRIERLLEFFTHSYYQANNVDGRTSSTATPTSGAGAPPQDGGEEEDSGASPRFEDRLFVSPASQHFPFATADACFIVVVATVMLNTDLHNPRVSSKMTREAFRSQLRGCNDGKDFPLGFADSIFDSIHKQPLSNVKGVGATTISGSAHVSTVAPPAGAMDMLFFSASERKELMFGMERQRLVTETRELVSRRSCSETKLLHEFTDGSDAASISTTAADGPTVALAVAKELFVCLWPSLCVVFGVAASPMVTGALPANARSAVPPQPDAHLLRICLRGLAAAFLAGTAFKAHKEADATLSTILKIAHASHHRVVREGCLRCLLDVGATEHAVYFTPYAWASLMQAVVEVKKTPSSSLSTDAESVFGLLEVLVARAADAGFAVGNPNADAMRAALLAITNNATALRGDGIALGAHLYVMRRMLVYTVVSNRNGRTLVERRIAMPLFLSAFGRAQWYELLQAHCESNECLQLLYEAHAELVSEVWTTVGPSLRDLKSADDVALFLECFGVLAEGMQGIVRPTAAAPATPHDAALAAPAGGSGRASQQQPSSNSAKVTSMLRMYVIQSVKTILASTIAATATAERAQDVVPLSIALQVWAILLQPLVMAVSDADSVASENCAVAVLALRHLIVCWCGTSNGCNGMGGSAAGGHHRPVGGTVHLPYPHFDGLGTLLAHVAYVGSMCADISSAHSCVAQFNTLITTVLNAPQPAAFTGSPSSSTGSTVVRGGSTLAGSMGRTTAMAPTSPISPSCPPTATTTTSTTIPADAPDAIGALCKSIDAHHHGGLNIIAMCVVERLCLLLRCEKQSVRQEVIDVLRHLPVLFGDHSVALHHFFDHLCHAVLEASLGHADPNHRTSAADPCLQSFLIFHIDVPSTMKRCSRTSFSATLPLLLHAVSSDVLPMLASKASGAFAVLWVERCMVPLTLSPRVQSHPLRFLALRALLQIVQTTCDRDRKHPATSGGGSNDGAAQVTPPRNAGYLTAEFATRLYAAVSFLLYGFTLLSRSDEQSEVLEAAGPLMLSVPPCSAVHTSYDSLCHARLSELQWREPDDVAPLRSASHPLRLQPNLTSSGGGEHTLHHVALLDDKAHLQQLWSLLPLLVAPLPKILQCLLPYLHRGGSNQGAADAHFAQDDAAEEAALWCIPVTQDACTTRLLVLAANHACALHAVFIAAVLKGDQALRSSTSTLVLAMIGSALAASSSGSAVVPMLSAAPPEHSMHPHAVVRGVLTSLFEIEMHGLTADDNASAGDVGPCAVTQLHTHLVETVSWIAVVADGASRLLQALSPGTPPSSVPNATTAVNHNILHLARTCCSGMMQEMSVVLASVTTAVHANLSVDGNARGDDSALATRRRLLRRCVSSEALYDGVVALLSPLPLAAAMIPSIKRFLMTLRALGPLPWSSPADTQTTEPSALPSCGHTVDAHTLPDAPMAHDKTPNPAMDLAAVDDTLCPATDTDEGVIDAAAPGRLA